MTTSRPWRTGIPCCQCTECECSVTIIPLDDGVCLLCRDGDHDPWPHIELEFDPFGDDDTDAADWDPGTESG